MKIKLLPLLQVPSLAKGNVVPSRIRNYITPLLPVAASICNDVDVDAKGRLPDRPLEPMLK